MEEARRFPWIKLSLEQLARHTPDLAYEALVCDSSFLPEHLEVLEASGRTTVFSKKKRRKDVRHGRALDLLLREAPAETE